VFGGGVEGLGARGKGERAKGKRQWAKVEIGNRSGNRKWIRRLSITADDRMVGTRKPFCHPDEGRISPPQRVLPNGPASILRPTFLRIAVGGGINLDASGSEYEIGVVEIEP
jgi:hypothetical protein